MASKPAEPEYKIIVDADKILWSDLDMAADMERAQHGGERAQIMRDRAQRKLNEAKEAGRATDLEALEDAYLSAYDKYMSAYEVMAGFKQRSAEMIDRVAAVTVNGKLTQALNLPYSIIIEVQRQIADSQQEAIDPN